MLNSLANVANCAKTKSLKRVRLKFSPFAKAFFTILSFRIYLFMIIIRGGGVKKIIVVLSKGLLKVICFIVDHTKLP